MPVMIQKKNDEALSASVKKGTAAPIVKDLWAPYISRCTTGQFAHLDHGFKNHCGPTAVTNMLLTLQKKKAVPALYGLSPEKLFSEVAALGRHILAYYNFSFWVFGGTTMLLTDLYIRLALKKYGLKNVRVTPHLFGTASSQQKALLTALDRGSLVYLQLLKHPKYGSHHLLVNGYEIVPAPKEVMTASAGSGLKEGSSAEPSKEGEATDIRLILADGWSPVPKTLLLKKTKRISFWEIRP